MISKEFQVDFHTALMLVDVMTNTFKSLKWFGLWSEVKSKQIAVRRVRHALLEWSFKDRLRKPHLVWQQYNVGEPLCTTGKKKIWKQSLKYYDADNELKGIMRVHIIVFIWLYIPKII